MPPLQFSRKYLTVKPRTEIDRTQWDAFAQMSSFAWLYHTYDMQDAIATWPGKSDLSFALVDEEKSGEIVATIPLHRINRLFLRLLPNTYIESMGGIAYHPQLSEKQRIIVTEKALEVIHEIAVKNSAEEIRVSLASLQLSSGELQTLC